MTLRTDHGVFEECFNRKPFRFQHDFADHPLLQLGALHDLAGRIPEGETLHWRGDIPLGANIDTAAVTHKSALSLRDTFDHIDTAGSYVLIRNAQLDPRFGRLVDEVLDAIAARTARLDPGMCQRVAYVFVASPRSVTPYHMDRDINFHFNVRGKKEISIWSAFDRDVLPEAGLETLFTDWTAPRPRFAPEYALRATVFDLGPGDGVHHPFTAPHAVRYGDDVAVSFTVTFNTRSTHRRAAAHFVNGALRRAGIRPAPVGASLLRDELKFEALSLYRKAKSLVLPFAGRVPS